MLCFLACLAPWPARWLVGTEICSSTESALHLWTNHFYPVKMTFYVDQSLSIMWPVFGLLDDAFLGSLKLVCVFGSSGNEAIAVTHDDQVYALGSNNNGCLGLGDVAASFEPRKVKELSDKGDHFISGLPKWP